MANSFVSDRIGFKKKSDQTRFLMSVQKVLGVTGQEMARIAGVSQRTFADWKRSRFSIPYKTAVLFSKRSRISLPENTRRKDLLAHLKSIAQKGGIRNYQKNGLANIGSEKRRINWRIWWEKEGKYKRSSFGRTKKIKIPDKSVYLAEFVGIMLGDGGVAPYHISVTLNSVTDRSYGTFVGGLIKKLYGEYPKTYQRKNANAFALVVQRKELVNFCQRIGLPLGNKLAKGLDIPEWVKQDEKLSIACVRGLFDTDGSMFKHCYLSKGKEYCYCKISLSSRSAALLASTYAILKKLGISVRISRDGNELRIESQESVKRFLDKIGTHNPKHGELRRMVRQRFAKP